MSEAEIVSRAYESGRTTFMGTELLVARGALVPRAETELLGRTAVTLLPAMTDPAPLVIDMCCGAGNLACAIARHVPPSLIWAADLTSDCVNVAQRNVEALALGDRVSVHQGDLFDAFAGLALEGTIDLIVCNPPYISEKRLETERAELLELEPREAFAAGPYGLSIHMRVAKDALAFLRPRGLLLFEVGVGQARQVKIVFERAREYDDIRIVENDAGEGRVVLARRKSAS
jgi:release factor glutamine methyltransferase